MPPESPRTAANELLLEKFATFLAECDLVAEAAGYGQTLDLIENFFSDQGRKFLNETFEQKLQEHVQRTETTAEAQQCPHCKKTGVRS